MKQHRPRVSTDNYQRVMSNLTGRFGENETFDNALWLVLTEYENLKRAAERWDDVVELLRKNLSNTSDLLTTENKRANKFMWISRVYGIIAVSALTYIGFCL